MGEIAPNVQNPRRFAPMMEIGDKLMKITKRSAHLWFLLYDPGDADIGDIQFFANDDADCYARKGRRVAHELFATDRSYRVGRSGRELQRVRVKIELIRKDIRQASEFNMIHHNTKQTVCVGVIFPNLSASLLRM